MTPTVKFLQVTNLYITQTRTTDSLWKRVPEYVFHKSPLLTTSKALEYTQKLFQFPPYT